MYAISPHMLDIIKLTLNHRMTGLIHCVTHKFLLHKQNTWCQVTTKCLVDAWCCFSSYIRSFIFKTKALQPFDHKLMLCVSGRILYPNTRCNAKNFLFKWWALLDLLHSYKIDLFHIKSARQNTLLLKLRLFWEHLACACYTLPSVKLDGSTTLSVITYSSV